MKKIQKYKSSKPKRKSKKKANKSRHKSKPEIVKLESPIFHVVALESFLKLSPKQQKYAFYLDNAVWLGFLTHYFTKSYESPALFTILMKIFKSRPVAKIRKLLKRKKFTKEEIDKIFFYFGGIATHAGDYYQWGGKKFVPDISLKRFEDFLKSFPIFSKTNLQDVWQQISHEVFAYEIPYKEIGLSTEGKGLSPYYSYDITREEILLIDKKIQDLQIDQRNMRFFREKPDLIVVRVFSSKQTAKYHGVYFDMGEFRMKIHYGDFSQLIQMIIPHLQKASKYGNKIQAQVLHHYVDYLKTGEFEHFEQSQIKWVSDIDPKVESNFGFQLYYNDPLSIRGEFLCFLHVLDQTLTPILQNLVKNASHLVNYLPWPKEFEKEKYEKPKFTATETISFAYGGVCLGLCLPHFDQIKEKHGFKNQFLSNTTTDPKYDRVKFVTRDIAIRLVDNFKPVQLFKTAFHEMLGHGSGKIFIEKDGKFNFDKTVKNPLDGKKITSWYKGTESPLNRFGGADCPYASYEECRSDLVAIFFSQYKFAWEYLSKDIKDWKELRNCLWLSIIKSGFRSLKCYSVDSKSWKQAHANGRYVYVSRLREIPGFITVNVFKGDDGKDDLLIDVNEKLIETEGIKAITDILQKIQIYKTLGDAKNGAALYAKYSKVNKFMERVRQIIIDRGLPRRLEIYGKLERKGNKIDYNIIEGNSIDDLLQAFVNRFSKMPGIEDTVLNMWQEKAKLLRYQK